MVLSALQILSCLIFRTTLRRYYCYPYLIDGEMETKEIEYIFFLFIGMEIKEVNLEKAA